MRILLVHNYYQQAGGEDHVFEAEAALLEKFGHTVWRFTKNNNDIRNMTKISLVNSAIWNKKIFQELADLIQKTCPEIVHFHNTFPLISPASYYPCHANDIPVLQTLHNYRLFCLGANLIRNGQICEKCLKKKVAWPGMVNFCYRSSFQASTVVCMMHLVHSLKKTFFSQIDLFIALSTFSKVKFIEAGIPEEKMMVKPNFVEPFPKSFGRLADYVAFVGRLSCEKGIETIIKAWSLLKNRPLVIVGDGPFYKELSDLSHSLNYTGIRLLGALKHDKTLCYIEHARFLIAPSIVYEHFPLVLVEAFSYGVPVIASNLGAMAEIVENGKTGLLFTPGDAEDLASKVDWAWNHPAEIAEMGKAARREYEEKYTAERNYALLMEIYQKAIDNRRRHR